MKTRTIITLTTLAFCFFAFIAGASGIQSQQDQEAQAAIERDFKKEDVKGVNIEVRDGTAFLSGRPRNVFVKDKALKIALAHAEEAESDMEIAEPESDKELGQAVIDAVLRYGRLEVFDDVNAFVKGGSVTLVGFVTEPYKSTEIEKRMYKIIGIKNFENKIEVLPNSEADRNLRVRIANQLYSDTLFEDFASMTHPPIRIIVKNSRVLLTGVVRGQLEKTRALAIVRGVSGVLSVEDRLRTER
jgi:osmotically-inducible protein OsmY